MRQPIRQQFDVSPDVFKFAGYGLFVGQKAEPGAATDGPVSGSRRQPDGDGVRLRKETT